jgi:hypothetical protein
MRFKADTILANPGQVIPEDMYVHLCRGLDHLKKLGYPDADEMHLGTTI